ncbi:MAG: hypothetical protein QXW32_06425 [Nitrososphaerales archaeon]
MQLRKVDFKREAILTERERKYLEGTLPLNARLKWKIYDRLDKRCAALLKDLKLIFHSPATLDWREENSFWYLALKDLIENASTRFPITFREVFRYRFVRGRNEAGKIVFWREPLPEDEVKKLLHRNRIFQPKTALKGLPSRTRKLLFEAIRLGVHSEIPFGRENAVLASTIRKKIKEKLHQ